MTEKKSLLARFDENNIVKISDDTTAERLFITRRVNGEEKYASMDYEGNYSLPTISLHLVNNAASNVSITTLYELDSISIQNKSYTITPSDYLDIKALYGIDEDYGTNLYGVVISGYGLAITDAVSDLVNCKYKAGSHVILTIDDPSENSAATITFS